MGAKSLFGISDSTTPQDAGVTGTFEKDPKILVGIGGAGIHGRAYGKFTVGVAGTSDGGSGVLGVAKRSGNGVFGESESGAGVYGISQGAMGVLGGRDNVNNQLAGVYGESNQQGVYGYGTGDNGTGVYGIGAYGVRGETSTHIGVKGTSIGSTGVGVWGESGGGNGVIGVSHHYTYAGVAAINDGSGPAFWAEKRGQGGGLAGNFVGDVNVTGKLTVGVDICLTNRDLAERFEVADEYDKGTVMVIGEDGKLQPCTKCYDKRAIGVIAGAGTLKPAITLGAFQDEVPTTNISLVGTAFCWVDAEEASIEAGDLLTTSNVTGHAMKANDAARSFGAIIGKALAPLSQGRGLIPIIVTLQ